MRSPLTLLLVGLLRAYRFAISPLYGQVCRYHPTCSAYALDAVTEYGGIKGSWLAAKRLLRCHPWAAGGYDPIPVRTSGRSRKLAPVSKTVSEPTNVTSGDERPLDPANLTQGV